MLRRTGLRVTNKRLAVGRSICFVLFITVAFATISKNINKFLFKFSQRFKADISFK